MEYAIQIDRLQKRQGPVFRLGPLDLRVPQGGIYGLIGPNGAGKTTLLNTCMDIGQEEGGTILILGMHHRRKSVAIRQEVGFVSPDLDFSAWGTVGRLIRFVRKYYPNWDDGYREELLDRFGISWFHPIRNLSFGSKVLLNLVIALSHRPTLLLLDEPTLGLDAAMKQRVFSELLAAVRDGERTVVISSHGLADLERYTDHVGFINKGKLILEGATDELVQQFMRYDCLLEGELPEVDGKSVLIQRVGKERAQLIISEEVDGPAWMKKNQLKLLSESPISLEELFVGFVNQGLIRE